MLSRIKLTCWLFLAVTTLLTVNVTPLKADPPPGDPEWLLIFSDEFNELSLDLNTWDTHFFWGRILPGNNEEQYYMDDAYDFTGSYIRLRADIREMNGFDYTSGMISSFDKFAFQYGYAEMRARIPAGQGFWPAFWLLPTALGQDGGQTWPPEIDVFEILGHQPNYAYMTNWYGTWPDSISSVQGVYIIHGTDFSEHFHTYAIEWTPNKITWYIDGQIRFESTVGISQEEMYLLATFAVGGDWPGSPDATTPFPSYYDIDYIRVWQKLPLSQRLYLPVVFSSFKPMSTRSTLDSNSGCPICHYQAADRPRIGD
jgi:beta-glucanase (GH16 family)